MVPAFELRYHNMLGQHTQTGIGFIKDDDGTVVHSYPQHHYDNGVRKNERTSQAYKAAVRVLKNTRNEMEEKGIIPKDTMPSFLLECLVWNAPDTCFQTTSYREDARQVAAHIWGDMQVPDTAKNYKEVSEMKWLLREAHRTPAQAQAFMYAGLELSSTLTNMTNHYDTEQKVSILTSALEERYTSIHAIRDRIQSVCLWALGLMLAAGGMAFAKRHHTYALQKITYLLGMGVALAALRLGFLSPIYTRGFQNQQRAAVRIEKALGLFTPGTFDDADTSLYPEKWASAGSKDGEGKFFASTFLLLYIGVAFLALCVLLHAQPHVHFVHHLHRSFWH